jgi:hypothetical protein
LISVDIREALLIWAEEKRRRDRGEPFVRDRVVPALRVMFEQLLQAGETMDPNLPAGLALGRSGTYDVENATDEEVLKLAEDMYRENRESS